MALRLELVLPIGVSNPELEAQVRSAEAAIRESRLSHPVPLSRAGRTSQAPWYVRTGRWIKWCFQSALAATYVGLRLAWWAAVKDDGGGGSGDGVVEHGSEIIRVLSRYRRFFSVRSIEICLSFVMNGEVPNSGGDRTMAYHAWGLPTDPGRPFDCVPWVKTPWVDAAEGHLTFGRPNGEQWTHPFWGLLMMARTMRKAYSTAMDGQKDPVPRDGEAQEAVHPNSHGIAKPGGVPQAPWEVSPREVSPHETPQTGISYDSAKELALSAPQMAMDE